MKYHNNTTFDDIACTSKPCEWNKPRKRKLSPKGIDELRPVKHQYGKEPRLAAVPALSNLLDGLRIVNPRCALFTAHFHFFLFHFFFICHILNILQYFYMISQKRKFKRQGDLKETTGLILSQVSSLKKKVLI